MYNRLLTLLLEARESQPCKSCGHPAYKVPGQKKGFTKWKCGRNSVGGQGGGNCSFSWAHKPKQKTQTPAEAPKSDTSSGVDKLKAWANKTGVKRKGIDEAFSGISRAYMAARRKQRGLDKLSSFHGKEYRAALDHPFPSDDDVNLKRQHYNSAMKRSGDIASKIHDLRWKVPTSRKRNNERNRELIARHVDWEGQRKNPFVRSSVAKFIRQRRADQRQSQID